MNTMYLLLVIVVMAVITMILRIMPFCFIEMFKDNKLITYLGISIPACIMVVLVIYSLQHIIVLHYPYAITPIISVLVVVVVHMLKRNASLSIIIGTVLYGVLQFISG